MKTDAQDEFSWFDPTGEATREWHKHGPTGEAIRRFFIGRWRSANTDREPPTFRGRLLERYVGNLSECTPGTPSRILRLMREDGMLDYEVINRAKSLYRILGVRVSETEILGRIRA